MQILPCVPTILRIVFFDFHNCISGINLNFYNDKIMCFHGMKNGCQQQLFLSFNTNKAVYKLKRNKLVVVIPTQNETRWTFFRSQARSEMSSWEYPVPKKTFWPSIPCYHVTLGTFKSWHPWHLFNPSTWPLLIPLAWKLKSESKL